MKPTSQMICIEKWYIDFRFVTMTAEMAVYATRKFARLSSDKYIELYRVSGLIAAQLTQGKPSKMCLDAAELAPNSMVKINGQL